MESSVVVVVVTVALRGSGETEGTTISFELLFEFTITNALGGDQLLKVAFLHSVSIEGQKEEKKKRRRTECTRRSF